MSVDRKNECVECECGVWSVECGVLSMTVPYLGNPLHSLHFSPYLCLLHLLS